MKNPTLIVLLIGISVSMNFGAFAQKKHARAMNTETRLTPLNNSLTMKDGDELQIFVLEKEGGRSSSKRKGRVVISKGVELFNESQADRPKGYETFKVYVARLPRKAVKKLLENVDSGETDLYLVKFLKKNRVYLAANRTKIL